MNDVGTVTNDTLVEVEIQRIESVIEKWVSSRKLWGDCKFWSHLEHSSGAEPWQDYPIVTIFMSEGPFNMAIENDGYTYEDFSLMLEQEGYWFEQDYCTWYILSLNETWNAKFKSYFRWKWICSLLKPDFNTIHHEMFEYFGTDPRRLQKLHWREMEILVYELLRSQGFTVELGPGSNDGGIDLILLCGDPVGDLLTAVQVKRYRSNRKIGLEAVQALYGAKCANEMNHTMFVTSSSFLPSAQRFAARQNVKMDLYTSKDVVEWCRQATNGIIEEKHYLTSLAQINHALQLARANPRDYVVHSSNGINCVRNSFAIKLKESKHAALLMEIPSRTVTHDGYNQRGHETPDLGVHYRTLYESIQKQHQYGTLIRAQKKLGESRLSFWTGKEHFSSWNGESVYFDHLD